MKKSLADSLVPFSLHYIPVAVPGEGVYSVDGSSSGHPAVSFHPARILARVRLPNRGNQDEMNFTKAGRKWKWFLHPNFVLPVVITRRNCHGNTVV